MALPTTSAASVRMVAMEVASEDWGVNLDMTVRRAGGEGVCANKKPEFIGGGDGWNWGS